MDVQVQSRVVQRTQRLPFEVVALVLRGGGAPGAYQAAVYEAPSEAGICPNRTAGMSIELLNKTSVGFAAASGAEDSSRHARWAVFFSPPTR
jgi:NTE family protein